MYSGTMCALRGQEIPKHMGLNPGRGLRVTVPKWMGLQKGVLHYKWSLLAHKFL